LNLLLGTHFLPWIVTGSARLDAFPCLARRRPWGVSPVSLLEVQLLSEVGKVAVRNPDFTETVLRDPRFRVDEVPLLALVRHALAATWTRDPFDRLLVAHSRARRVPLCTVDRVVRLHHPLLPPELGGDAAGSAGS
jgi:PIN domain nuclease of toxin-antitoxin system